MKMSLETKALIVVVVAAIAGWFVLAVKLVPMFIEMKKNGY